LLFLLVSYLLWGAVTLRWIDEFIEQRHPLTALISFLLVLFGVLLGLEPLLTGSRPWRSHLYLLFQTGLVFIASLFYFELDFFALLYLPLAGQAMFLFPRRTALAWVGVLIAVTLVGQLIQFNGAGGLPFFLLYTGGLVFVAAYSALLLQAEAERQRGQSLLDELQEAHQQLQQYAGQAEELAVARERNRLARELHDSVTQTLYGLRLQSEAASRKLAAGDTAAVEAYLQEFRRSVHQTLHETRLLIFELRPPLLEEEGLQAALLARLESVEARSGLQVRANLDVPPGLPPTVEDGLYGIAIEALNNILKHARARQVTLSLSQEPGQLQLVITDDGIGFDPHSAAAQGGLGLRGLHERAALINGHVRLDSTPGAGTTLEITVPDA
jgi:signal transduction histidine kinase